MPTLGYAASSVRVTRRTAMGDIVLPGLVCESVAERLGPYWPTATLRYRLGVTAPPGSPVTAFEAADSAFTGPGVLEPGDEVIVSVDDGDGQGFLPIFHGIAYNWQPEFSAGAESCTIQCMGIARTAWNLPLLNAEYLDASVDITSLASRKGVRTDRLARFNPQGQPCLAAIDYPVWRYNQLYWLFVDPARARDTTPLAVTATMDTAACYVMYEGQGESTLITLPDSDTVRATLVGKIPIEGVTFDPSDPSTYTTETVLCPDMPITGKAWPIVLHELIQGQGYTFFFETTGTEANPLTRMHLLDVRTGPTKELRLQPRGASLDLALTNTSQINMHRDLHDLANRWVIDGAPERYEVGLILKPSFPMDADDASPGNLPQWESGTIVPGSADWPKYRDWIANEGGGQPWYVEGTADPDTRVPDFDPVFGEPDPETTPPEPKYVPKRRPPIGELLSLDAQKQPLRASLWISTDYVLSDSNLFSGPHVFPVAFEEGENSGHWQQCQRGWQLLSDRLGIRITCENPNSWHIGKKDDPTDAPFPSGAVNVVECLNSVNDKVPFYLKLVVCMDADRSCLGMAEWQGVSPLPFVVERRIDARERLKKHVVHGSSPHNSGADPIVMRDDTGQATAEATLHREASQAGVMGGTVTIPFLTQEYRLGDRITGVWGGEGLSFNTGGGGVPTYPVVIARRWELGKGQRTVLELSDSRHLLNRRYRTNSRPTAEDTINKGRRGLL